MFFNSVLQEMVESSGGGIGAVLMGYDGIAIDQFFRPVEGVDLGQMAVEYSNVLKEIRQAAEILNTGAMEEVFIKTDKYQMIIRALNHDYFVALTLGREGNFGKGRYLLMRDAPALREALG
ncbi:MAG: roadblock/LC7 domain-containing protein [Desulfuromonadales bacterium]